MRRPHDLAYGVDDQPPAAIVLATALQQATIVIVWMLPAAVLAREVGASPAEAASLLGMAFIACGIGAMVQATRRWGLGSGFLAPVSPSTAHLIPSLLAAQAGGLPLVAGMTIAAGVGTIMLARVLHRLRTLLPPEVAGAAVFIIGIAVTLTGARLLLGGGGSAAPPSPGTLAVALLTLLVAIGLGVWGRGALRWGCVLIAMIAGTAAAVALGQAEAPPATELAALPAFALPDPGRFGYAFDAALLPAFLVASLASTLKTAGMVTTLQRLNDADWVRPDARSIAGGVTGDGIATTVAGLLGAPGVNLSPTNVAVQLASGVSSRVIGYATGGACLALACFPRVTAMLYEIPAPVIAATLIYAGGLMLANGMQLACSRLLDNRRSLSVGLAVAAALTVEAVPQLAGWVPEGLRPLASATAFGTLTALLLNALLRVGVRRRVTLTAPGGQVAGEELDAFVTSAGASWGARREVVARASNLAATCMDAISASGCAQGDVALEIGFDEFRIEIRIAWQGPPVVLADRAPTADEMLDDPAAPARLAGFLMRRLSDRLRLRHKDGLTELLATLDH
jgi:NCS2 family nucleobase:cation symporter-2